MPPTGTGEAPPAADADVAADTAVLGRAPECRLCPICAGLAALRDARPEAVEHLVKAGVELLLAARALLDAAAPDGQATQRRRPGRQPGDVAGDAGDAAGAGNGLQRIDIG
jgi:hypothetical protein